jgi:hypothetical protein
LDYALFQPCIGELAPPGSACELYDMNGDGAVGQPDYSLFLAGFGGAPGPSGIVEGGAGSARTAQAFCGLGTELTLAPPALDVALTETQAAVLDTDTRKRAHRASAQ